MNVCEGSEVMRQILDDFRKKWQEAGENYIKRRVVVCTSRHELYG